METKEVIQIVNNANLKCPQEWFSGKTIDGKYFKIRLIVTEDGQLRTNIRGSIDKFKEVDTSGWLKLRPRFMNKTQLLRDNIKRILEYLDGSGLWKEYIPQLTKFSEIPDTEIEEIREQPVKKQREFLDKYGITLLTTTMLRDLLMNRKCVRTVFYGKEHMNIKQELQQAFRDKKEFKAEWRSGFDNIVIYNPTENKAYYTEKYRGQEYGHHYLLIDDMHVTFVKDK